MEPSAAEHAAALAAQARDAALSAQRRRAEGIVHTPQVLARAVARLADEALRSQLGLAGGIADAGVGVVDPACGPGAFLAAALAVGQDRGCTPAAMIGVDRDRAALDAGRQALAPELARACWPCELLARDPLQDLPPAEVAARAPALCIIGNPPWIGRAQAQPAPFMRALLADFARDDRGQALGERKVGVLADAYVRFLRWSLELARLAQRGAVVALVTNGSYLDGPVHRGLRAFLLRELDDVAVIDLGGNALLPRTRERDDNVFGVRPQVAVLIATRRARPEGGGGRASLRYLRIRGSRTDKLARLEQLSLGDLDQAVQRSAGPLYRLVPTAAVNDAYAAWPSLPELMPFHREGVQTNRDAVVVDADRARLLDRLRAFADGAADPELAPAIAPKPHYDPERARAAVRAAFARDPSGASFIRPIQYRAFDRRWFVAVAPLCHRPRPDLLAAMDRSQLALVSVRKDRGALPWTHVAAAKVAIDNCLLSTRSSCRARAFPSRAPDGSENVSSYAAAELAASVGRRVTSEELVCYALAVLSAPVFRARFDAALRLDYPRIPWPPDAAAFEALVAGGRALAELHTSDDPQAGTALARAAIALDPLVRELLGGR